ncbi:hypothetical protein [Paraburkholderia sp. J8-2]|uniref:hypothetical protein n=1 Tax=Paraburkholderia sp. J8-2 TaxID=2805440 RepID=UPI002AB756B8|nr:hypothetical protein [Paraburkholderia sp. J8-2]
MTHYLSITIFSILALSFYSNYRRGELRLGYGAATWLALSSVVATIWSRTNVAYFLANLSVTLVVLLAIVQIRRGARNGVWAPPASCSRISKLHRIKLFACLAFGIYCVWTGVYGVAADSLTARATALFSGTIVIGGLLWIALPARLYSQARS